MRRRSPLQHRQHSAVASLASIAAVGLSRAKPLSLSPLSQPRVAARLSPVASPLVAARLASRLASRRRSPRLSSPLSQPRLPSPLAQPRLHLSLPSSISLSPSVHLSLPPSLVPALRPSLPPSPILRSPVLPLKRVRTRSNSISSNEFELDLELKLDSNHVTESSRADTEYVDFCASRARAPPVKNSSSSSRVRVRRFLSESSLSTVVLDSTRLVYSPNQMEESPWAHLLSRCVSSEFGSLAKAIHSRSLKLGNLSSNLHLVTNLIVAYSCCGVVDEACQVFDEIPNPTTHHHQDQLQPDLVCWNAVISGCIRNQRDETALRYFKIMQSCHSPDSYTLSSILSSGNCLERNMSSGEQLHACIIKTGSILLSPSVGNSLITFYARWGRLPESKRLFQLMPVRNVVSWTALISGHAQRQGQEEDSLRLFCLMMRGDDGARPNQFTFASILGACGSLASLSHGLQFIALAVKMGLVKDIHVQNAQVGFYSECGCLEDAKSSFQAIDNPDTVSWNSLLKGYAHVGRGREALRDFNEMLARGAKPDGITFLSVLSACSHAGMTTQGIELFLKMEQDYRIEPQAEHIACLVNLLGRAGKLDQAREFVEKFQFEPSPSVWRTLLGACRVHSNAEELAELAAKRLVELEPYDTEAHVVLSNIYASRERWDLMSEMRNLMKEKRVFKEAGFSWITIGGRVHYFTAADGGHPEIHEIETRLMELINNIKDERDA